MTEMQTLTEHSTTESVDLYREVHKGLRLALFELASTAGALDDSDPLAVAALTSLFADVDMMLVTHHGHEDGERLSRLIHRPTPQAALRIDTAHDRINVQLEELRKLMAELAAGESVGGRIYDAIVELVADYLAHMQDEESVVMPVLQRVVPGEELTGISMAIRSSVPPPDMCVFLRFMLPAMNSDERIAMLGGIKTAAPQEIFELFWGIAETSLSGDALALVADGVDIGDR